MAEKLRYSDEELQEFKQLIIEKLEKATKEYESYCSIVKNERTRISDRSTTFKVLEEEAYTRDK